MSRRASLYSKQNPGKPRVRFPDELVFEDNIKENDLPALHSMLRRTSLQMDINAINGAGVYNYRCDKMWKDLDWLGYACKLITRMHSISFYTSQFFVKGLEPQRRLDVNHFFYSV